MTTAHDYAEAVFLASRGKDDAGAEAVADNLHALLTLRGHTAMLPAIVREFEKLHGARGHDAVCSVHVANGSDRTTLDARIAADVVALRAADMPLHVVVDDTLIGGYEVRANGTRIDRTYKRSLLALYTNLITNT